MFPKTVTARASQLKRWFNWRPEFFAMGGDTADSDEPACFGRPAG